MAAFEHAIEFAQQFDDVSKEFGALWEEMRLEKITDQDVASKLLDMALSMGAHQAAVLAQRAVNAGGLLLLNEDGKIGPKTLGAINAMAPEPYVDLLRAFSAAYYRFIAANHPEQAPNLGTWLKRAEA